MCRSGQYLQRSHSALGTPPCTCCVCTGLSASWMSSTWWEAWLGVRSRSGTCSLLLLLQSHRSTWSSVWERHRSGLASWVSNCGSLGLRWRSSFCGLCLEHGPAVRYTWSTRSSESCLWVWVWWGCPSWDLLQGFCTRFESHGIGFAPEMAELCLG